MVEAEGTLQPLVRALRMVIMCWDQIFCVNHKEVLLLNVVLNKCHTHNNVDSQLPKRDNVEEFPLLLLALLYHKQYK